MFKGMRDDVTLVVGRIVPIPVIVVHMRNAVNASPFVTFHFRFSMDIAVSGAACGT